MLRLLTLALGILAICGSVQAQDIQYDEENGIVTVYGGNTDDVCNVRYRWNWGDHEIRIKLWYRDENWNWDQIKQDFPADKVVLIQYHGMEGDDEFEWENLDDLIDAGYDNIVTVQYGGPGEDILCGGPAPDLLDGGADYRKDTLIGDASNDIFVQHFRLKKKYANYGSKDSVLQQPPVKLTSAKDLLNPTSQPEVVQVRVDEYEYIVDFDPNENDEVWWNQAN